MIEKILNETLVKTTITIILLILVYIFLKKILDKILEHQKHKVNIDIKKVNTLKVLFTNFIKYILIVIGILVVLNALGFKISSIIAGLGVFSAVLALALQDTLKDLFAGIFILLENQFSIGDVIEVGGFKGKVTFLGLKSTRIQSYTGEIKIISNRNIAEIINYSKTNQNLFIDVNIAYEEETDNVFEVLNKLCEKLSKTTPNIKSDIKLLGVQKLDNSAVTYRLCVETSFSDLYDTEREILKQIKIELDKQNIKIPYPQLEVHHGKQ